MKISSFFSFLFFVSVCFSGNSQFAFNYVDSISVIHGGNVLKMPWAGGLNYIQISDIDYDYDGDMDLLVFDRSQNQVKLFERYQEAGVSSYRFDPYGKDLFPDDMRYRLFAIDYNGDNKKDLFTYGIGGLKVYKNMGDASNGMSWELAKELVYSDYWGVELNLYVSSTDIPAIVDVDNDGDIDVLTFHIGGQYIQYHQNKSMELYNHADSLVFELRNECWGKVREDVSTNTLYLDDQTPPCEDGNVPNPGIVKPEISDDLQEEKAHAGSSLLALDIDNSGVKDLIVGDVAFTNLNLLINSGSEVNANSPMISVDPSFPSNSIPVNTQLFPAAFYVDVDFDEVKDLIVAPNAKNVSENETSVMKYKNTGSNLNGNFVFETNEFLQEDMIDYGTGSIPKFVDIDGDGLTDMFIAHFFAYKPVLSKESRVAYYKNTGTLNSPEFTLIDKDFQNLSSLNVGLRMVPAFGDINGDSKIDMFLGLEDGTLVYFENNSTGSSPTFSAPVYNYTDNNGNLIHHGLYATPQLFDLNKDGLLDLIFGVKTGEIIYYQNTGSASNPEFTLVTSLLGGIDVSDLTPDGYPVPNFFSHNDTTYAIIGCIDGTLKFLKDIDNNIDDGDYFTFIDSSFLNMELGAYSSAYVLDIDNDTDLDLFLGQDLGGIFHLENEPGSNLGVQEHLYAPRIEIYPNPFNHIVHIKQIGPVKDEHVTLCDYSGKLIRQFELTSQEFEIDLSFLDQGMYVLHFVQSGVQKKISKK